MPPAEFVAWEELENNEPEDIDKIDPVSIERTIEMINKALKDKPADKKIKQKLYYAKNNWPENLKKYEQQGKTPDWYHWIYNRYK